MGNWVNSPNQLKQNTINYAKNGLRQVKNRMDKLKEDEKIGDAEKLQYKMLQCDIDNLIEKLNVLEKL